jgi:hypothetical protein
MTTKIILNPIKGRYDLYIDGVHFGDFKTTREAETAERKYEEKKRRDKEAEQKKLVLN